MLPIISSQGREKREGNEGEWREEEAVKGRDGGEDKEQSSRKVDIFSRLGSRTESQRNENRGSEGVSLSLLNSIRREESEEKEKIPLSHDYSDASVVVKYIHILIILLLVMSLFCSHSHLFSTLLLCYRYI